MTEVIEHLDLEDDYPEYVDETWGYAWAAWDTLSAHVIARHDDIVAESIEDDPAGLTNLERWALVRNQKRRGESFLDTLRLILSNHEDQAGLNMPEIFEFAVRALASHELFDEAEHAETTLEEHWPEYEGSALARVTRKVLEGEDANQVVSDLLESWADDVDRLIELANELRYLGKLDAVRTTLAAAQRVAEKADDRPSLLDIQLFLETLPE